MLTSEKLCEYLVRYCSPTLAGMKTGSLFSCPFSSCEKMREELGKCDLLLEKKGLRVLPLKYESGRALVYVYRPAQLSRDLKNKAAREILDGLGYCKNCSEKCVSQLMKRLCECKEFPHEIGLFLGYPPEDVRGFIDNNARGYKCAGCWKVYGDAEFARGLFEKYKKCTAVYTRRFASGSTLERLAVSEIKP